jgi:hypothetical protein
MQSLDAIHTYLFTTTEDILLPLLLNGLVKMEKCAECIEVFSTKKQCENFAGYLSPLSVCLILCSLICSVVSVLHLEKKHEERESLVRHLWKNNKLLRDCLCKSYFFRDF